MRAGGWAITQASSPYYARKAFWCIRHTMAETMGAALPYFTHVPSFGGVWGLVLAQKPPGPARHKPAAAPPPKAAAAADSLQAQQLRQRVVQQLEARLPAAAGRLALRYLNAQDLAADFRPAPDYSRVPTVPNTLNNQALVRYYQASWRRWR
jgi:spermidine synthase